MAHLSSPEYFTLISISQYSGEPTVLGIFESMKALSTRLELIPTSCGDEYRIECFHLATEAQETERYNEVQKSRVERAAQDG